ncbi:MAG: YARHG domain-containing protein [Chitinophagaceae bacterium]
MKKQLLISALVLGIFGVIAVMPSCRPDEKECPTALQDSLNVRELRLRERETSLRERELGVMERESALGIHFSKNSTPNISNDGRKLSKEAQKAYEEKYGKAAYKAPILDFPGQYPESSERALTMTDLEHLTPWGKKVMMNEIYARHGFVFTNKEIKKHFDKESWYKGTQKDFNKLKLTALEKANIAFLDAHPATER